MCRDGAQSCVLAEDGVPFVTGRTWTTDVPYRETPAKIAARRAEGCITVEMEAAALAAVARFRGVPLAQVLYGGDDLTGEVWDSRDWTTQSHTRDNLVRLAGTAALRLAADHAPFMALPLYDGALDGVPGRLIEDPLSGSISAQDAEAFNQELDDACDNLVRRGHGLSSRPSIADPPLPSIPVEEVGQRYAGQPQLRGVDVLLATGLPG